MPIAFDEVGVFSGAEGGPNILNNPTSLQFGPDGRLYVTEQNGSINAFTVAFDSETGEWAATDAEELVDVNGNELVKNIQNHDDFGNEIGAGNRQVTGILVGGTADEPILYISSSNPNIASNGESNNVDTNSGVLTQASFNSTTGEWEVVDLIRGLPRSEENHAVNGMVFGWDDETNTIDETKILLQVGGFTNNGGPSNFFSFSNEYALAGAILEIDLADLAGRDVLTDPQGGQGDTPRNYVYDLPTLDDPNVENVTDGVGEDEFGMDEDGPWGGNDGLNQAILPLDAPLRIYADGLRNAYDLTRTPDGKLYTVDNGSNGGLGGAPSTESNDDDGDGILNEAITTPNSSTFGEGEPLLQIVEGGYYYHANPVRSNQNQSWTVYGNDGNPDPNVTVNFVQDISALVPDAVDIPEGFLIHPDKFLVGSGQTLDDLTEQERNERLFLSGVTIDSDDLEQFDPDGDGPGQQVIEVLGSSTNGIVTYDSGGAAFGGSIDGALFVTQFNDNITLLNINSDGTALDPILEEGLDGIYGTADDVVQDADGVLFVANNSLGVPLANPLDVTVGPDGTLWVAEIGGNEITVLAPTDFINPLSDDSDSDGILNVDDPFLRDPSNGTSVVVDASSSAIFEFSQGAGDTTPGPDGFGGGLTGALINGVTDYEQFYQSESTRANQNIQLDNVKFVTAANGGTTVIEAVSNGDPFQDNFGNNAEFLFHTGVTFADSVETATISWVMFNPAAQITGTFQQIGGYIGDGTQSNYLKVVAIQGNAPVGDGIQVSLEENDAIAQTYTIDTGVFDTAAVPANARIFMDLVIDFTAETATPTVTYETNSGSTTVTGDPIDLAGSTVLDAIKGDLTVNGQAQGLAVGLFSSNNGEEQTDTFEAVFDSISVTATETPIAPVAGDDESDTGIDQALVIPVGQLLANDTDANSTDTLTITDVSNAQNGVVSLENGVVTFTPNDGFSGAASFDYTVSDGTLTDTGTVNVNVADQVVLFRLNAGGPEVAAADDDPLSDLAWAANTGDGATSGPGFSFNTGNASTQNTTGRVTVGEFALPDYVPQAVFTQERFDPASGADMEFTFGDGELAAGIYTVNIYAGNGFNGTSGVGQRVFDINVEGGEVDFDNVDLVALLGDNNGGLFSWTGEVTDGTINIDWARDGVDGVENPLVNAIEILGAPPVQELPTIDIVSGDQTIDEDAGTISISILTSETVPEGPGLDFTYVITGVTALEGADYEPSETLSGASSGSVFTGNATIAGSSSDITLPIDILQDDLPDAGETFTVEIVSVGPGYQIGNGLVTITIDDDDAIVEQTIADANAEEGTDGEDTISYEGSETGEIVLQPNVENLELNTTADVDVTGNALENIIKHGAGSNTVDGGLSDDTFLGDASTLDGDTILNFEEGDKIVVEGAGALSFVGATEGSAIATFNDGTEDFTLTFDGVQGPNVFDGELNGQFVIENNEITFQAASSGAVLYRVNAGGPTIVVGADDASNPDDPDLDWDGDTGIFESDGNSPYLFSAPTVNTTFNNSSSSSHTGTVTSTSGFVPAGTPLTLFDTERGDRGAADPTLQYQFDVGTDFGLGAGDSVEIRLYFAEIFNGVDAAGERVFDVSVNGSVPTAFDDVDAFAEAGANVGIMRSVIAPVGADGLITLEFVNDVENPAIKGIEILAVDDVPPVPAEISIAAPDPVAVPEDGDTGVTTLEFPVTFNTPPGEAVTIEFSVDINGDVTMDTLVLGTADGVISVEVPNDGDDDGDETVTVTLTGVTVGSAAAVLGSAVSAVGTVNEDDAPADPGEAIVRINAGGIEVAANDGGIAWSADLGDVVNGVAVAGEASEFLVDRGLDGSENATSDNTTFGSAAPEGPGTNATGAPDALFTTERFSPQDNPNNIGYAFDLGNGDYTVNLYFDELFFSVSGARVFDVEIEGVLVLDDFDTFVAAGNSNNTVVESFDVTVEDGVLNLEFLKTATNNPHIAAIEILSAEPVGYTPPLDDFFGTAVELSDNGFAPTVFGPLADGDNILSATQEGEGDGLNGVRDRDYFTVEIPEGKILTGIFLDSYDVGNPVSPDGFFAFQEGPVVTTNPTTGENVDALTGAIIYGTGDIGTNLLETMRAGFNDPATGTDLPGFDQKLTGDLTFWLNQGAGPNTPTLRFVVEDDPDAGVPGAYLPNADGDIVIEAEDARFGPDGLNGWEFQTEHDLDGEGEIDENHEAFNGDGFIEWDQGEFFGDPSNGQLKFAFTPDTSGVYYVNLRSSKETPGAFSEHNDAFTRITDLDGDPLDMLPGRKFEDGELVTIQPTFTGENGNFNDGWHKTFQSGGPDNDWKFANKNVDNTGIPIAYELEAGVTYHVEIAARSNNFAIDRIHLDFIANPPGPDQVTNPINPPEFAEASPQVPIPAIGEATLTVNNNSDNIEVSNFGNGSFVITNTGTKNITSIEIDVSDAILPDAVFDPLGVAGDTTAKILTLLNGSDGGTGLVVPIGGFGAGAVGVTYLDGGGIDGFERIRLEFTDFNAGETISFGVDMDPNSIAGAQKATLDSGAGLTGAGGNNIWDVGGIAGAELANSTFTVTYADETSSVGDLIGQGTGQQSGATAVSSQDSENLSVLLSVNGLGEGTEGTYGPGGPLVTVQGPAGETVRIMLAKGFIVPFENNFADDDPFKAQLDQQLAALAATGFPANNVVEYQYVDFLLDGTEQDVTSLFDFTDVDAFDLSEVGLDEAQLPLGFSAAIVDTSNDEPKGPVTDPIHLIFSDNEPPEITDPGAQSVDEGTAFSLQIVAVDPDGDTALIYALEVLDALGEPVAEPPFVIDPDTGEITGDAPLVLEETTFTARVTVTDTEGEVSTLDVPITVADTTADADLSLTKTVSDLTPAFGDTITFTLTVTNDGPDGATGVQVSDLLPNGFDFTSAAPSVGTYDEVTGLWDIGDIASGDTITLTIDAVVLEEATPAPDAVIYRVNPGGDSTFAVGEDDSVDDSEPDWVFDDPQLPQQNNGFLFGEFAPGVTLTGGNEFGNEGGPAIVDITGLPVGDEAVAKLFETERFGTQEWDFDVENGDYTVNLYFAEIFANSVGARVFDVEVEGALVLDDYDIFAEVGANTAVLKSFDTTVADGNLDIDFTTVNDNAKISAIEIIQKGETEVVNHTNFAEIITATTFDPDSTPGDGAQGQDDDATVIVTPTALGENLVTISFVSDAAEPDTVGQFLVSLEEVADTDTVITYSIGGDATPDEDYVALTGSLTILAGSLSDVIDVTPIDDDDVEEPETVIVTLTGATGDANIGLGDEVEATVAVTSEDLPPVIGSALIEITPDEGIGASTFGGTEAFQITNSGVLGDADITSISFDLSTGILPDMVFDPTGAGGDETAQGFSPDLVEATAVGLVAFTDPDVDPFSAPRNGGFDVITIDFTDFNPGETFSFSVDVDPNSIQGVPGAGNAGAVSGYELIGSTVSITFSDGTREQVAVSSLYDDGSLGGAQSLGQSQLSTVAQFAAPTIELLDNGPDESTLPGDQQSVPIGETTQTVRVTGEVGANVSLLQMDARLFIASGGDPFDVSDDELPFYANEALSGKTLYSGVIGEEGFADIEVVLLTTPGEAETPDGGLNHFIAVLSDVPYTPDIPVSQTSNTLVVRQAEPVEVSIAAFADAAEPTTNGSFLVSLAAISAVDTVISYELGIASTATPDADYTALSGTVTILAGELTASIDVLVLDDLEIEEDETVEVALTEVLASDGLAVIGEDAFAVVTITSEDVNLAPVPAAEGNELLVLEDGGPVEATLPEATDDRSTLLTYALADPLTAPDGLVLNMDGTFSLPLELDFVGEVVFDYVVEDEEGGISDATTFTITVDPVNDAPGVVVGEDIEVGADAGPQVIADFANTDPGGGADEADQTVSLDVQVDDASLFAVAPAIDANGQLTFEALSGVSGTAIVTVTPTDDGGTDNGGVDTGAEQTFQITILPPDNTAPVITSVDTASVDDLLGNTFHTVTATDGENDQLIFSLEDSGDADLFEIDQNGNLSFAGSIDFDNFSRGGLDSSFNPGGKDSFDLVIEVSDGELTTTQEFTVSYEGDADSDGVVDTLDNAILVANGLPVEEGGLPGPNGDNQIDTDGDGYGNVIDFDFAGAALLVDFSDLDLLITNLFTPNQDLDFNNNNLVDFADLDLVITNLFNEVGPSFTDFA